MPAAISIRSSTAADSPNLLRIWRDSVLATHFFLSEMHFSEIEQLVSREYLPFAPFWVAEIAGETVGFLGQNGCFVASLFIAPASRGTGVGKALLAHAKEFCGRELVVDVNEQNEQAVGFYAHLGFVPVGRSACDGGGRPYPVLHMREGAPACGDMPEKNDQQAG